MKKIIAVLLSLVLVFSMVACGNSNDDPSQEGKEWKVAVLLPRIGDQSFFDSVNAGRIALDERDNVQADLIEIGEDVAQYDSFFQDACESGYDLIVSGYATYEPYLYKAAKQYPDQLFFNYDYSAPEDLDNVYAVTYKSSDMGYIAGALSALITESDMEKANSDKKIGAIVGMESDYMNDFIGSFCQAATDYGVQAYISYPNSFKDTAKAKEQALAMYNDGVDIIWQVAGGAGLGVFEAAAGSDKYAIGVDSDQVLALSGKPELASTIVSSIYKDCGAALINAVDQLIAGTYPAGTKATMGLADGTVGLVENEQYTKMVPEAIRTEMQEVIEKIKNGDITPYSVIAEPEKWESVKAEATARK